MIFPNRKPVSLLSGGAFSLSNAILREFTGPLTSAILPFLLHQTNNGKHDKGGIILQTRVVLK